MAYYSTHGISQLIEQRKTKGTVFIGPPCIYIFHLTWPTSLHYLVKRECSQFYLTLDLLESDCSDLVSKWRRPLSDMHRLSQDEFCCLSTGRCPSASKTQHCHFSGARETRRLSACIPVHGAHFQHEFWQFWAHLSWQLITLLNKSYFSLLCANPVVRQFAALTRPSFLWE